MERTSTCASFDAVALASPTSIVPRQLDFESPSVTRHILFLIFFGIQHFFYNVFFKQKTNKVPTSESSTPLSSERVSRSKNFSEDQKNKIAAMQKPAEMEASETQQAIPQTVNESFPFIFHPVEKITT